MLRTRSQLAWVATGVMLFSACASAPRRGEKGGELLRFETKEGDELKAKVRLSIDADIVGGRGGDSAEQKATLTFDLQEEEHVNAVGPDGTAEISASLVDVTGKASGSTEQKTVDDFALALDELKIKFQRTSRGEIASLTIDAVRAPLDERTARTILNAIYGAARGALFPEEPVVIGSTWEVDTDVGTPLGIVGKALYTYLYARKTGTVATITCQSKLEGKSAGQLKRHILAKSTSEYQLDTATGHLVSSTVDASTQVDETGGGQNGFSSVKQRIRLTWTAK